MGTPNARIVISALLLMTLSGLVSACGEGQTGAPPSQVSTAADAGTIKVTPSAGPSGSGTPDNSAPAGQTASQTNVGPADTPAGTGGGSAGWLIDVSKVDPCSLLTREEAESIMGRSLNWNPNQYTSGAIFDEEDRKMDQDLGRKSCVYEAVDASNADPKGLLVQVWPADTWWGIEWFDLEPESRVPAQDIGLASQSVVRYDPNAPGRTGTRAGQLPKVCDSELPCAVARDEHTKEFIFVILPDWTSVGLRVAPSNAEHARQLTEKILGRLLKK